MAHEVIRYQPEHRPEAARLLTEFWPDAAIGAEQVFWMHEQNPYTDHPFIYLLMVDGKAVGMQAFYGAKYEISGSGETFDAVCGTMAVTDKSARGHGFATAILEGALEDIAANGYPYVFSYSARPIPHLGLLRHGWHLAGEFRAIGPKKKQGAGGLRRAAARRLPLLRKLWRRTGRRALGPQRSVFASLDALTAIELPSELNGGTLSVSREADAPAMAELAGATAIPGLIRHVRDPAYFDWRYKSNRMEYRFIYWRGTKLRGFLVLQKLREVSNVVHIVDWEAPNEQILKGLFRVAIDSGNFASLTTWSAALSGEMISFLSCAGFDLIDESMGVEDYRPGLLITSLNGKSANGPAGSSTSGGWEICGRRIDDLANWDLRPVYSESF